MTTEPSRPTDAAPPRKGLFDTILTATPVILTVLATLLAAMSSGAMTQAMYHRSVAAQNQSKAGDQWNFFQAKRIRGTTLESTVTLLLARSDLGELQPVAFQALADRLASDLNSLQGQAEKLLQALSAAPKKEGLGDPAAVRKAAESLQQAARAKAKEAEGLKAKLGELLSPAKDAEVFSYLNSDRLPTPGGEAAANPRRFLEREITDKVNPRIIEALAAIAGRKPEAEGYRIVAGISEEQVRQALETAEARATEFDNSTEPAVKVFRQIDGLLKQQRALVLTVDQTVRKLNAALVGARAEPEGPVRSAAAAIAGTADDAKASVEELTNDFKAAQIGFDARRYEREAQYNRFIAELYEVQVRKSSLASDQHRRRSNMFFFGMLAAQAGVTIATFSLSLRQKSVFWALASVAGLAAILIGGYVYLFVPA